MSSPEQPTSGEANKTTTEPTADRPRRISIPGLKNPFARRPSDDFGKVTTEPEPRSHSMQEPATSHSPLRGATDRRMSKEWDASKVPPSRFQKREGSIFSTAGSRDSHITRKDRDQNYHAKLKEKGWV